MVFGESIVVMSTILYHLLVILFQGSWANPLHNDQSGVLYQHRLELSRTHLQFYYDRVYICVVISWIDCTKFFLLLRFLFQSSILSVYHSVVLITSSSGSYRFGLFLKTYCFSFTWWWIRSIILLHSALLPQICMK